MEYHPNLEQSNNPAMTLEAAVAVMEGSVSNVMAANMMASVSNEIRSLGQKMERWMGMLMEWRRNTGG